MAGHYRHIILTATAIILLVAVLPICIVKLDFWKTARYGIDADDGLSDKKIRYDYPMKVYLHETKKTAEVSLEEYVKCVVASEMPANFEQAALQAQAIAARTYAVAKMQAFAASGNPAHPQAPLCDDIHCQVYRNKKTIEELKSAEWIRDFWGKIEQAADSTAGDVMTYQGELVEQPLFHSSSGGRTENSEDVFSTAVAYLRSVESPYEQEAPHQHEKSQMTLKELQNAVKKAKYGDTGRLKKDNVQILQRSTGGNVEKIKLGKLTLRGRDVRNICGLRSANFGVEISGNNIIFTTEGYGHGVGMSQWGANGMAQNGYTYDKILTHYYSGIEIKTLKNVIVGVKEL